MYSVIVLNDNVCFTAGFGNVVFTPLERGLKVKYVAVGEEYFFIITEHGTSRVFGVNPSLGVGITNLTLTLPNGESVEYISCNRLRACITNKGNCYVWGENQYGQLGNTHFCVYH